MISKLFSFPCFKAKVAEGVDDFKVPKGYDPKTGFPFSLHLDLVELTRLSAVVELLGKYVREQGNEERFLEGMFRINAELWGKAKYSQALSRETEFNKCISSLENLINERVAQGKGYHQEINCITEMFKKRLGLLEVPLMDFDFAIQPKDNLIDLQSAVDSMYKFLLKTVDNDHVLAVACLKLISNTFSLQHKISIAPKSLIKPSGLAIVAAGMFAFARGPESGNACLAQQIRFMSAKDTAFEYFVVNAEELEHEIQEKIDMIDELETTPRADLLEIDEEESVVYEEDLKGVRDSMNSTAFESLNSVDANLLRPTSKAIFIPMEKKESDDDSHRRKYASEDLDSVFGDDLDSILTEDMELILRPTSKAVKVVKGVFEEQDLDQLRSAITRQDTFEQNT